MNVQRAVPARRFQWAARRLSRLRREMGEGGRGFRVGIHSDILGPKGQAASPRTQTRTSRCHRVDCASRPPLDFVLRRGGPGEVAERLKAAVC
jgi:hypothetical protein